MKDPEPSRVAGQTSPRRASEKPSLRVEAAPYNPTSGPSVQVRIRLQASIGRTCVFLRADGLASVLREAPNRGDRVEVTSGRQLPHGRCAAAKVRPLAAGQSHAEPDPLGSPRFEPLLRVCIDGAWTNAALACRARCRAYRACGSSTLADRRIPR